LRHTKVKVPERRTRLAPWNRQKVKFSRCINQTSWCEIHLFYWTMNSVKSYKTICWSGCRTCYLLICFPDLSFQPGPIVRGTRETVKHCAQRNTEPRCVTSIKRCSELSWTISVYVCMLYYLTFYDISSISFLMCL